MAANSGYATVAVPMLRRDYSDDVVLLIVLLVYSVAMHFSAWPKSTKSTIQTFPSAVLSVLSELRTITILFHNGNYCVGSVMFFKTMHKTRRFHLSCLVRL